MRIVCIAGGTCSGKTTLARRVEGKLGRRSAVAAMDNYYKKSALPAEQRAALDHDLPSAFDWPLLREHVASLAAGGSVEMPLYDYATHDRLGKTITLLPADVLILEGLYALYDEHIVGLAAARVFLDSSADQRRERRLRRDAAERGAPAEYTMHKLENLVEPAYRRYIEPTRSRADLDTGSLETAEAWLLECLRRRGR